jgi:hypothetical protein
MRIVDTVVSALKLGNITRCASTVKAHVSLHGALRSSARPDDARMQRLAMSDLQDRK